MRKLLLLLFTLLTSVSSAWATDVIWESLHGWTQSSGGVGSFNWYGAHTPGDNTITYSMSSIQLKQSSGNNNTNYLAIATVSPGSSTTIAESNVLAVSSNSIKATTSTLYEYTFSSPVSLTGGTTYYLVFVTANTPTDGVYTIQSGRMEVNHLNCYAYSYGNNAGYDWCPYFKATLTTTETTKHYGYSCKNLAGFFLSSGYLLQDTDPTTGDAPSISGYTCQSATVDETGVIFTYALTSNPLTSATTSASDMATKPKYTTIESVAGGFVYYAEEGGAVKGWSPYDKDGDDAHWIIVGDEANGYKLYNALTGTSKVAVVADENGAAIQMKDEASNTASLFDIRYIEGSHRLYKKGTKWCTNRLSSSTRLMGIHTNVNNGSKADVSRYSKTVTYKLKWNNSEITSQNVSVPTGDAPADYLPSEWNRAYCNYTCDVSYVTTETSTVNVTMNWDGPFDFSTDFASAKWYYLKLNNKYVYYDTESPNYLLFSNDKVEDSRALWAFFGNPYDGVKVANLSKGDGYFISNDTPATMETSGFVNNQIGSNAWGFYLQDSGWFIYDDGSGHVVSAQAAGYEDRSNVTMKVEPYVLTYNLKFGGSTIATKTMDRVTGASENFLPSEWTRDFCTYSYEPAEISISTPSVDVTMTWNGPFDISADYENAVWYYLAVNGKWGKNNSSGFNYTPDFSSDIANVKGTDGGQWAFFGNPYDGFLLSLKEKYNNTFQVYLSSQLENPAFSPSNGSTEKWTVTRLSGTTFTLNCGEKYIVDNSTTMGFKTTALEGSEGTFSVRSYYCQQALDDLADYAEANAVGQYFGVRQESIDQVRGAFESLSNMSQTDYGTTYAVPTGVAGYLVIKKPADGFYRIKNVSSKKYIGYGTAGYSGKGDGLIEVDANNLSSILYLKKVSDGVYKISTQGLNAQTQSTRDLPVPANNNTASDYTFTVLTPGVVSIRADLSDAKGFLYRSSWGSAPESIITWDASDDVAKWTLEDAGSVAIPLTSATDNEGTHSYATLCVPFNISNLEGANDKEVKAYVPTKSGDYIVTGDGATTVTAGMPVILVGEEGATSVTATIGSTYASSEVAPTSEHVLKGTYKGATIDCSSSSTNYVLGLGDGDRIGFYHVSDGSSFNLKPNRAYLKLNGDGTPINVKGFMISFDVDEETEINSIENGKLKIENEAVYDMSGRRIQKPTKGLYIVGGRKVIVK